MFANRQPSATVAIRKRIPEQASATSNLPVGIVRNTPSMKTGMPINRRPSTTMAAVTFCRVGIRKSPNGTAKNRKASGNSIARTSRQPRNVKTTDWIMPTSANSLPAFMSAALASVQATTQPKSGIRPKKLGRGAYCSSASRRSHSSQPEMGTIMKP